MTLNLIFIVRHYFLSKMPYYAVANGRDPGVYDTWDECKSQVHQYSGAIYKKFGTMSEAQNFISERSSSTAGPSFTNSYDSYSSSSYSGGTFSTSDSFKKEPYERKISTNYSQPSQSFNQDKAGFMVDKDGYVNVFTDGACSSNGYKNARAGIGVWFQDNHPLNVSEPVEGRATNNMAEIQAVTRAARQAQKAGIDKLKINTDSQFLISCATQWMPNWKRNGWVTSEAKPVINKTELLEMEEALKPLNVTWVNNLSNKKFFFIQV
ncbi:hypothetical protein PUN28_012211 [Cardiocondyla obscurior]|uniref:Ribonuclease H1 n=1 Tax=Cardiocondyla obscurior TaxID=286306 RepID=A0AAW2FFR8_9HYME